MSFTGKQILQSALDKGIAITGFDAFNMESAQAVASAAEALSIPVFLQVCVASLEYMGLGMAAQILKEAKRESSVDICLHFDHGPQPSDINHIAEVIESGFESVMVDGSSLSLKDNVALTKKAVELAHRRGVCVEAEVGTVTRNLNASREELEQLMTDPDEAAWFVEETGADYLAVSVGSISGQLQGHSTLDLERLRKIRDKVPVPLVFHGGTGIPLNQLQDAVRIGVGKVNIAHGLRKAFLDGISNHLAANKDEFDPRIALRAGSCSAEKFAINKMKQLALCDNQ